MSTRSKSRIAAFFLIVALTSGVASAAPKRDDVTGGVFNRITRIVKQIGRILLPTILDEPTLPKP
jgi:hypothetical protein